MLLDYLLAHSIPIFALLWAWEWLTQGLRMMPRGKTEMKAMVKKAEYFFLVEIDKKMSFYALYFCQHYN